MNRVLCVAVTNRQEELVTASECYCVCVQVDQLPRRRVSISENDTTREGFARLFGYCTTLLLDTALVMYVCTWWTETDCAQNSHESPPTFPASQLAQTLPLCPCQRQQFSC